jgi:hypothetical protein
MNRRRPRYRAILEISRPVSSRCVHVLFGLEVRVLARFVTQQEVGTNFVLTELSLGD